MVNRFTTKILEKKELGNNTFIFTLNTPSLDFKAGQFITFVLKDKEGKPKPRSYSLFSPPNATSTQLLVELIPKGVAGEAFNHAAKDTEFSCLGPLGSFYFQPEHKKSILIATNTGLAPMHSILSQHIDEDFEFTLIMGAKYKEGLFLHEEFLTLEKTKENFTYKPTISREEQEGIAHGRVQQLIEFDKDAQYYICGSKQMVLDTKQLLEKNNILLENIHYEIF